MQPSTTAAPTCSREDCAGLAEAAGGECIAHVPPDERRKILERLEHGMPLDFTKGVPVSEALFAEIVSAAPRPEGRALLRCADFSGAVFEGEALFTKATFAGKASFRDAAFRGVTSFDEVRFNGQASFRDAIFTSRTTFRDTEFAERASFRRAIFEGRASFREATFGAEAVFHDARFDRQPRLDLVTCKGTLELHRAWFAEGFHIVDLRGSPDVVMEGTALGASSALAGPRGVTDKPRLVSLRAADVANLLLAEIDFRACRFINAHNLDRLRLEGGCEFAEPPSQWSTRRTVIAEEQQWRADPGSRTRRVVRWRVPARERDCRWYPQTSQPPQSLLKSAPELSKTASSRDIATVYRDLRAARERAKNEPGAGEFYYGEMEMRRLDREAAFVERAVLTVYWLVSGYGLRAWRAVTALLVTVVVLALAMHVWGFHPSHSYGRSLLFAAQSSISLLRGPSGPNGETDTGQVIEIILRLAGPLFFGLALLAVRARVKR